MRLLILLALVSSWAHAEFYSSDLSDKQWDTRRAYKGSDNNDDALPDCEDEITEKKPGLCVTMDQDNDDINTPNTWVIKL